MMRHHYRKILSTSFPHQEGSNAVDVKPKLAHVEKHYRKPEMENDASHYGKLNDEIKSFDSRTQLY